jgi:4-aminobutyrate aminotransferase
VLEKEGDIGAVIAEPIRCTAVNPPPEGFWQAVRRACDAHGALLIFDETAICLGRTGRMFAHEHYVEPDILVLGKGLGGGLMPLAAMLARKEYDRYADSALGHYTHEKNPLCCAAGLATIEVVEEEGLVTRSERLGKWLLDQLNQLMSDHDKVRDVRGLGLMAGVWLDHGQQAEQVMYSCLERGLSFKVSQSTCVTLTPPLTITEQQLEQALQILAGAIAALPNHPQDRGTYQA